MWTPLSGDRVEDRRERGHEGLALAGPHLGDLALVEDGAADQLDVEVAHLERPDHRLAGHREDVGEDVVERVLDLRDVPLAACLRELAPALEVGVVELVVGRLLLHDGLAELVAQPEEPGPDVLVGQGLDLGFQLDRFVDERLDPLQLTVVRIDEPGKETKHGCASIGAAPFAARSRALRSARARAPSCQICTGGKLGRSRPAQPTRPRSATTPTLVRFALDDGLARNRRLGCRG